MSGYHSPGRGWLPSPDSLAPYQGSAACARRVPDRVVN
jgi:hypothetical protein